MRTTLRGKGQVTLPAEVRNALMVEEGDEIEFVVEEEGRIVMRGLKLVPAEQAWFWRDDWQAGEREASDDIAKARTTSYDSAEDFLASLD